MFFALFWEPAVAQCPVLWFVLNFSDVPSDLFPLVWRCLFFATPLPLWYHWLWVLWLWEFGRYLFVRPLVHCRNCKSINIFFGTDHSSYPGPLFLPFTLVLLVLSQPPFCASSTVLSCTFVCLLCVCACSASLWCACALFGHLVMVHLCGYEWHWKTNVGHPWGIPPKLSLLCCWEIEGDDICLLCPPNLPVVIRCGQGWGVLLFYFLCWATAGQHPCVFCSRQLPQHGPDWTRLDWGYFVLLLRCFVFTRVCQILFSSFPFCAFGCTAANFTLWTKHSLIVSPLSTWHSRSVECRMSCVCYRGKQSYPLFCHQIRKYIIRVHCLQ